MQTIVIKNLSTCWDEIAVSIVQNHVAGQRNREYLRLFEESKKRFNVDIGIKESATDGCVTYTIVDAKSAEVEGE